MYFYWRYSYPQKGMAQNICFMHYFLVWSQMWIQDEYAEMEKNHQKDHDVSCARKCYVQSQNELLKYRPTQLQTEKNQPSYKPKNR